MFFLFFFLFSSPPPASSVKYFLRKASLIEKKEMGFKKKFLHTLLLNELTLLDNILFFWA